MSIDRYIRRKREYLRDDFIDELSEYEITGKDIEPFCFHINTTPFSHRNGGVGDMKEGIISVLNKNFKKLGKKPFFYSAIGVFLLYDIDIYNPKDMEDKHSRLPDSDNVQKAVWDSCCGSLISDDKPIMTSTLGFRFIDGESKIIIFGYGAYK